MRRRKEQGDLGQPRSDACPASAQQPKYQDALAPDDAADQCVFEEGREPGSRDGTALSLLQFRAGSLYYSFVRVHKTLRTSPAMAEGITKRLCGNERRC